MDTGMNEIMLDAGHSTTHRDSLSSSPSSSSDTLHPHLAVSTGNSHLSIEQPDEEEETAADTPLIRSRPSTSPIISHLGPISPIEELTPAIVNPISSPRRTAASPAAQAQAQSDSISSTATSESITPSSKSNTTCKLVLDWSHPRTSGAIFQSSSGVSRVQLAVRPPIARAQASIERLKWSASSALYQHISNKQNTTTRSTASITIAPILPSPTRNAIKASSSDQATQIPLPGAPLLTPTLEADLE
ncbi:hypothetical protein P389DRAFT_194632 [Cystobasidium minutum MCA 4210]|uniref:uncharacterized protein n=1 Tax=Cystobasidium minutum MCA 4210 TaxID=1397322 RepID=UPI0034CF76D8|eukprot:jgi/Rhomi1/194632/gm1.2846_g